MSRECEQLHRIFEKGKRFDFDFNKDELRYRGIYVFYQKGEIGHGGDRIVRIGQTGDSLGKRLTTHFYGKKDRSIFRKNIGRVFLRDDSLRLEEWNVKGNVNDTETEGKVSEYIKENCYFKAIVIEDEARRNELENKMIATVYNCDQCGADRNWFGNYSPIDKIRYSGLWQTVGLDGIELNEEDLAEIEQCLIK